MMNQKRALTDSVSSLEMEIPGRKNKLLKTHSKVKTG